MSDFKSYSELFHAGMFSKVVKNVKNKSIEEIYAEDKYRAIRQYPTLSSDDKRKLESLVLNDSEKNRVKGFIENLAKSSGKEYLVLFNKLPSSNDAAIIYGSNKNVSGRRSDTVNKRHKR